MKIGFLIITPVIIWLCLLVSVVSAAPHNQYQDPIKERRIAAYTWLYGESVAGNEVARGNLKLLERIYGPALTILSKRAAIEWQGEVIDRQLGLEYGSESFSSDFVIGGTNIGKILEKWGYYPSRDTMRAVVERWIKKSNVVSTRAEYSRTSFGLMQGPVTHLVGAWTLGYNETNEPLVLGVGTSARIARRYP